MSVNRSGKERQVVISVILLVCASAHGDPTTSDPSSESPFLSAAASLTVNSTLTFESTESSSSTMTDLTSSATVVLSTSAVSTNTTMVTKPSVTVASTNTSSVSMATSTKPPTTLSISSAVTNHTAVHHSLSMSTPYARTTPSATPSPPAAGSPSITRSSVHHAMTSSSMPSCPTGAPQLTNDCTTSLAIAVGVSVPGTAIITFFITSLTCLCCQKVKKKRSYIRLAPTVYFDEEEQD